MSKKLAVIGASCFQEPLIRKAQELGFETHVFAWKADDVGERIADCFYPISITEKEEILKKCKEIGIDGICSIGSDLAMLTVNYIAMQLGLPGNTIAATEKSTNKHLMRLAFEANGDPSPRSVEMDDGTDLSAKELQFPLVVKPTDRSGSRGIFLVRNEAELEYALQKAKEQSFEKKALVEEYVEGKEYSVEYISFQGKHCFLALTEKFTSGAPHYIETAHLEPAAVQEETLSAIKRIVEHALDTLELRNGASHSEVMVHGDSIRIIEIGGRMGGDYIGSFLVPQTTGYDYVRAVIDTAVGLEPEHPKTATREAAETEQKQRPARKAAAVRFIFSEDDVRVLERLREEHPEYLIDSCVELSQNIITDSSNRQGWFLFAAEDRDSLLTYLPKPVDAT